MTDSPPLYIDATMIMRWQHLAPVGIVRLERLLAAHLRFRSDLTTAQYVVWDRGYRPADHHEVASLDALLERLEALEVTGPTATALPQATSTRERRVLPKVRRVALQGLGRVPGHLRPFAENAAWSVATFGVESARYSRRAWSDRRRTSTAAPAPSERGIVHRADFPPGTDLVALGLGWEYIDHEAMYRLAKERGVRIHMPAFDLIPVLMPQMNAGQSHLVHRYYAEMAHYADSITSISEATRTAIEAFFRREELPIPHLAVNPLPGLAPSPDLPDSGSSVRRHRFEGDDYVLTVSTIEVRKNHLLLAKIWTECIAEGVDLPKLVLVGRFGWDVDELRRWVDHAPELVGKFVICTDVDDDELVALYQDARFTVFPSRIEGWGLPITEALSYGKVCVHSTDPAQFEASQGIMPAFHPDDFLGWKEEILRMNSDDEYRQSLEREISNRYSPTTVADYCTRFESIIAGRRIGQDTP
jgi:glycosyltransferase involved in cell wall biosynthesis